MTTQAQVPDEDAQTPDVERHGGGPAPVPRDHITPQQRAQIIERLDVKRDQLQKEGKLAPRAKQTSTPSLSWPLQPGDSLDDEGYHGISNFVDHDEDYPDALQDYECGTRTYDVEDDEYNHRGVDFFTWPFPWYKMDYDEVEVVAIADGTILGVDDGNFDRSCALDGGQWNAVYVEHDDGSVAWYGHLKNGSTTDKEEGDAVQEGEYLGVVGSSGNSTGPHLHLEIYDAEGNLIDPYEGPCNTMNDTSWWDDQRPYYDSAINAIRTHSAEPDFSSCPQSEVPNFEDEFERGDPIIFAVYMRDQLRYQISEHTVRRPDGSTWKEWTHALTDADHYQSSYWWWEDTLSTDADEGIWSYEVVYEGATYTHAFAVGVPLPVEWGEFHAMETNDAIRVEWHTLTETNNAGFDVQRKRDDGSYETLGFVEGHGTTNAPQRYTFTDTAPPAGDMLTYRLRQVDYDGTADASPPIHVRRASPEALAIQSVAPEPVSSQSTLRYTLPHAGHARLVIYNALGQPVKTLIDGPVQAGHQEVVVDTDGLASGTYFARLEAGGAVDTARLTVVR